MPTLTSLLRAHLDGTSTPEQTVAECYARYRQQGDDAIFITLRPEAEVLAEAVTLQEQGPQGRRLWGIPVAVKDNIDVAGLPTTAACPGFAYRPATDATVVARLRAEGALIIGKTNLDQFATGLNGTRSPYGVPRNALNRALVPGGSSSGSASAVAAGIVPVALGTDTAGSGRVPAGLQNLVGLKPTLGLVPTTGVVPACRTLDCVSVFAMTVEDAWAVLEVIAGTDPSDAFSRPIRPGQPGAVPPKLRIGVPRPADLDFDGDAAAQASFTEAVARAEALGASLVQLDMAPLYETAKLLYDGPWVAERYLAIQDLLGRDPEAILPVIREVIASRPLQNAAETFAARYRVAELALAARAMFATVDLMMVPTAPRPVTLEEMAADPIGKNSLLGRYTNFVNLLDLCALAVPASLAPDGTAAGVTLIARSGSGRAAGGDWQCAPRSCRPDIGRNRRGPAGRGAGIAAREARLHRDRRRRRPSLRHAPEPRADIAGRDLPARGDDDRRLQALCPAGRSAEAAGACAGESGRRCADRGRGLGDAAGRLWPLRRRHPLTARDRYAGARRRADGQGLPLRGHRHRWRAGCHGPWRLACLYRLAVMKHFRDRRWPRHTRRRGRRLRRWRR